MSSSAGWTLTRGKTSKRSRSAIAAKHGIITTSMSQYSAISRVRPSRGDLRVSPQRVLAEPAHRAGLRPLFAFLFVKCDAAADFQFGEPVFEDAVAVEINLAAARAFEKSESSIPIELRHGAD